MKKAIFINKAQAGWLKNYLLFTINNAYDELAIHPNQTSSRASIANASEIVLQIDMLEWT